VARYAFQLAQAFSNFYQKYSIIHEEDREKKVFLLWMTDFFRKQLERTAGVLGITIPAYMFGNHRSVPARQILAELSLEGRFRRIGFPRPRRYGRGGRKYSGCYHVYSRPWRVGRGIALQEDQMRCRICGGLLESRVTDLPFKIGDSSIVILRSLPVLQCRQCGDTELEQATMTRVDQLLAGVDGSAELEVIRYAA
jgi:YgiT-type zinc finger domain-containing protein